MSAPDLNGNEPTAIEPEADPRLRLVIFSEPGFGKTELALSFPRPLVIDTDDGLEGDALRSLNEAGGMKWEFDRDDEDNIIPGHQQLEALWFWGRDHRDEYDTIIFDSGPTLCSLLLNDTVDAGKGKSTKNSVITDFVAEQAEYQVLLRQFTRILTDFRRLKKHMVVTAGVRDRDGKRCPDFIPSLLPEVNHWCSVAGELVIRTTDADGQLADEGEEHRLLAVRPNTARWAKTRYETMLPYVFEPTFEVTDRSRPGATSLWDLVTASS